MNILHRSTISGRRVLNFSLPVVLPVVLPLLLAACAEHVAVTETKPVPPLLQPAAAAIKPAWAGRMETGSFTCEQGNNVEIKVEGERTEMVWKGRSYAMMPVATSTGAVRFENQDAGMVWIQIPSKSMLLNSKLGQQLANNCKNR